MGGGGVLKTSLKARARRAVIKRERERVRSRFVQQKSYYWSKYCLKRYVLRLVLKAGRGNNNNNNREFTECFRRLKALYN